MQLACYVNYLLAYLLSEGGVSRSSTIEFCCWWFGRG